MRGLRRLLARGKSASAVPPAPEGAAEPRLWRILPRAKDVLILVALFAAVSYLSRFDFFQGGRIQEIIQGLGAVAPLAFVLLCVVTTITYVPATLPIGLGSIAFGHMHGGALSLLGISVWAGAAYLLGRVLGEAPLEAARLAAGAAACSVEGEGVAAIPTLEETRRRRRETEVA